MILCGNPKAQYLHYKAEIDQAIAKVLDKGRYILGEEVAAFELEFAAYVGTKRAFGVANGTDALHLAIRACDIGPGDEVITVAHTAVATVAAIELSGATPVLVDIEPDCYTIDLAKIEQAITDRTKAIIPVHIYGQPAQIVPLMKLAQSRGIKLIEDCAQAHGATFNGKRVGSFGDLGCFSFYPTKNLGAIGDGGGIVTNDHALAQKVALLREYGWKDRYVSLMPGTNSRLDELQAAILRVKLRHLDADNARRAQLAHLYATELAETAVTLPVTRQGAAHVFHLYVIRSGDRDALQKALADRDINALVHYPMPIHLQPAYRDYIRHGDMTETERAAEEILSLPMYPELTEEEVMKVAKTVRELRG